MNNNRVIGEKSKAVFYNYNAYGRRYKQFLKESKTRRKWRNRVSEFVRT